MHLPKTEGVLIIAAALLAGCSVSSYSIWPSLSGDDPKAPPPEQVHNTKAIGNVIYTDYIYLFQAAGLVLLVAMVGAIVLTLRQREGVRKQSIAGQVGRRRADSVELKDMPSGSGV